MSFRGCGERLISAQSGLPAAEQLAPLRFRGQHRDRGVGNVLKDSEQIDGLVLKAIKTGECRRHLTPGILMLIATAFHLLPVGQSESAVLFHFARSDSLAQFAAGLSITQFNTRGLALQRLQ